jgi:trk system potassium uptake protein TrkH
VFAAEATGPTKEKIHPKISETAKRLFYIYLGLTIIQTVLLHIAGMGWFDAVCHSATTIATGGFSTKQDSIAHWSSPLIQYIIIIFMLLSGVNFSLYYFGLKRRFDKIKENEELRYYLLITLSFTIIITVSLFNFGGGFSLGKLEKMFREALFTVSSTITSTGFSIEDYMLWRPFVWVMLLMLMLMGASAGSTSGGMKMVRVVIAIKTYYYEFKRMLHPNAVVPIRYNNHIIKDDVILRALTFIVLYFVIVGVGTLVLSLAGVGFEESISGMISCLSNIGPALGDFGPAGSYLGANDFVKWFLAIVMLIGRLELFTVLLLFTPAFWKR